jgi:hypothetical protein
MEFGRVNVRAEGEDALRTVGGPLEQQEKRAFTMWNESF